MPKGGDSKSYAVVFEEQSPSVYCDWECFKILTIAEGDKNLKHSLNKYCK